MVKSMTEAHKRPNRHPKYKTAYRVKNWREHEKSLRDRGDITLWISQDALDAWTPLIRRSEIGMVRVQNGTT
jgi:hypothetical protein